MDPFGNIEDLSEKSLIEKLGITQENVRQWRKSDLTEGLDYRHLKYNQVTYTRTGLEKLLVYLGLRQKIEDNEPVKAIIVAFPANRNILIARLGDGREVRVRIKAKHNFVIGKEITIQRDPGGLFELKSPYPNKSKFITVIA